MDSILSSLSKLESDTFSLCKDHVNNKQLLKRLQSLQKQVENIKVECVAFASSNSVAKSAEDDSVTTAAIKAINDKEFETLLDETTNVEKAPESKEEKDKPKEKEKEKEKGKEKDKQKGTDKEKKQEKQQKTDEEKKIDEKKEKQPEQQKQTRKEQVGKGKQASTKDSIKQAKAIAKSKIDLPFIGTRYSHNDELHQSIWNDFIEATPYEEKLTDSIENILEMSNGFMNHDWYNYAQLRMDLLNCNLPSFIADKMLLDRSRIGKLPSFWNKGWNNYREIIEKADSFGEKEELNFNSNSNSGLFNSNDKSEYVPNVYGSYYVIYVGIWSIFGNFFMTDRRDKNDLFMKINRWLVEMLNLSLLGKSNENEVYKLLPEPGKDGRHVRSTTLVKLFGDNKQALQFFIKFVFFPHLNIKDHIISDAKKIELYQQYMRLINRRNEKYKYYMISRLVYLMFTMFVLNKNTMCKLYKSGNLSFFQDIDESINSKHDIESRVKKLCRIRDNLTIFFRILFEYCVTVRCLPHTMDLRPHSMDQSGNENESIELQNSRMEPFFISQFLQWKDYCTLKSNFLFIADLESGDTLLTSATDKNMIFYCKLLVSNGYNMDAKNVNDISAYEMSENAVREYFDQIKSGLENRTQQRIEVQYKDLRRQLAFCRLFLQHLGCRVDKTKTAENENDHNELHFDYNDCMPALMGSKEAMGVMEKMVECMINLIDYRLPLSDDLLVLCWEYCQMTNNKELSEKFIKIIQKSVGESLNFENKTKTRDHTWFREFLLNSNLWFLRSDDVGNGSDDVKTDGSIVRSDSLFDGCRLLYNEIDDTVDNALISSKEFIRDHIVMEETNNSEHWNKILNYSEFIKNEPLRQDRIENGVSLDFDESDLWNIACKIKIGTAFDCFHEYNLKSVLNKCLITAHALNHQFQQDMRRVFTQEINPKCLFQRAPVKTEDRCNIKAQTDYARMPFPNVMSILDYLRCSITFDTCEEMIDGLKQFFERVEKKDAGCVIDVVRCKNMFKKIKKWIIVDEKEKEQEKEKKEKSEKSDKKEEKEASKEKKEKEVKTINIDVNKCGYCDIKFNIIISHNGVAMIGEIQFLLSWMLTAKTMGHSLYGVKRRRDLVESVNGLMNDDLMDNGLKYKNKIMVYVNDANYESLGFELLLNQNDILSMKSIFSDKSSDTTVTSMPSLTEQTSKEKSKEKSSEKVKDKIKLSKKNLLQERPILYDICQVCHKSRQFKLFKTFYASMVHFDRLLALWNSKQDEGSTFMKKYLTHPNTVYDEFFWSLETTGLNKKSMEYKIIETLIKHDEFEILDTNVMYRVCTKDCLEYMKLLLKYCKNDSGILKGINQYKDKRLTPLMSLLFRKHCNVEYLNTFLSFDGIDINLPCTDKYRKFNQMTVIEICQKNARTDKRNRYVPWAKLIEQYPIRQRKKQEKEKEKQKENDKPTTSK